MASPEFLCYAGVLWMVGFVSHRSWITPGNEAHQARTEYFIVMSKNS